MGAFEWLFLVSCNFGVTGVLRMGQLEILLLRALQKFRAGVVLRFRLLQESASNLDPSAKVPDTF